MNNDCIEQAQRYLVLRDHNHSELRTKLKEKGFKDSDITSTFEYLEDLGFLDEARYVQSFIRSSNRRHPEGRYMLQQRLAAKGTDQEVAKAQLQEIYTEEYTDELMEEASQKLQRHGKTVDRVSLAKQGFSPSEIARYLAEHKA